MKDTLVRDGATNVETVPMTFKHLDGHIVAIHGDDFIAAGSQQGLSTTTWRARSARDRWRKFDQHFCQTTGAFFRRTVEFADGAFWWKPDPRQVQECIEGARLGRRLGALGAWNETYGAEPR